MPSVFPTSDLEKINLLIWISFEKMAVTNFTGQNTKMGGLLVFKLKGSNRALTSDEDVR